MPNPAIEPQIATTAEHLAAGRYIEARQVSEQLLAAHPDDPDVLHVAGLVYFREGATDLAIDHLTRALELQPDSADMLANLGQMQFELNNNEAAQACFEAALDMAPEDTLLRFRYALTLHRLGQHAAAEAELRRVLREQPNDVPALYNLGLVLAAQGRTADAITAYEQAISCDPMELSARSRAASLQLTLCQWAGVPRWRPEIIDVALRGGPIARPPLPLETLRLPVPISAAEFHALAVNFARAHELTAKPCFDFPTPQSTGAGRRLRVGYVSSDFGDHPVGHVVESLFRQHDRSRFEVVAYALSPDDGTPEHRQIAGAVERLVDLSAEAPGEAARRINSDRIDILIDLNGHTRGNRLAIFAQRPAPVQATWLGFPGTLGVDFIDYLIADPAIVPVGDQASFTERLVHLPETYFAVAAPAAGPPPSRAALGLPERGIVFCAFTLSHKIEPLVFGIWMRLLQRVPGSVLWLRVDEPTAVDNLRREAASRGITAERLIFAPRAARADHLRRQRAADIYLDTLFYNGHSTAAEALVLGLPVVTGRGQQFAARVGASFVQAAGLPELVAGTPEDYEATALRLATDPGALADVRRRLGAARTTSPLFAPARFARHLEAAYRLMWENHVAGRKPQAIQVSAIAK
jgi:predicted O-linked N-acetylglucosamine transferase (SPINDLY family)